MAEPIRRFTRQLSEGDTLHIESNGAPVRVSYLGPATNHASRGTLQVLAPVSTRITHEKAPPKHTRRQ